MAALFPTLMILTHKAIDDEIEEKKSKIKRSFMWKFPLVIFQGSVDLNCDKEMMMKKISSSKCIRS